MTTLMRVDELRCLSLSLYPHPSPSLSNHSVRILFRPLCKSLALFALYYFPTSSDIPNSTSSSLRPPLHLSPLVVLSPKLSTGWDQSESRYTYSPELDSSQFDNLCYIVFVAKTRSFIKSMGMFKTNCFVCLVMGRLECILAELVR